MKLIIKGVEPPEWTEYRNTPGTDYQSMKCLRESLYIEQGGICAYCSRRLFDEFSGGVTTNKIEHLKARSTCTRDERMQYSNMVLCCSGISGKDASPENTHCDTHRGNDVLSVSPLNKACIDSISYSRSGQISSSNPIWDKDINVTLNLNHPILVDNRKAAIKAVINVLGKKQEWKVSEIKSLVKQYEEKSKDGLYKPHCDIIVWRLKKFAISKGAVI